MGATESKATSEVITDMSIDILMEDKQTCAATAEQIQKMVITASGNVNVSGASQTQKAVVNAECLMKTEKQIELQNKIANAIAQAANATKKGMMPNFGSTDAEVSNTIHTRIKNEVSIVSAQEAIGALVQKQTMIITSIDENVDARDISQAQDGRVILKAVLESQGYSKIINDVANSVDQSVAASTDTTLQFGGMIIIFLIIAVVFFVIYRGASGVTTLLQSPAFWGGILGLLVLLGIAYSIYSSDEETTQ